MSAMMLIVQCLRCVLESPACLTLRHGVVMCLVHCPGHTEQKYLCTGKDRAVDKQMPIVSPTEASAMANSR